MKGIPQDYMLFALYYPNNFTNDGYGPITILARMGTLEAYLYASATTGCGLRAFRVPGSSGLFESGFFDVLDGRTSLPRISAEVGLSGVPGSVDVLLARTISSGPCLSSLCLPC